MAKIITFDGMSGTGKSTQLARLKELLETEGARVFPFREPSEKGRTRIKSYRQLPVEARDVYIENLILTDDRKNQFSEDIEPLLGQDDAVILMDRSKYSAYAYQGDRTPLDELVRMNSFFPDADLALVLLCEPCKAHYRIAFLKVYGERDSMSPDEEIGRLRLLKGRFEQVLPAIPNGRVIGADGSEGAVFAQVRSEADSLFGRRMEKVVILDKDGVMVDNSGYPEKIPEDEMYPFVPEAVRMMKDAGYKLHIVSNQSWIYKQLRTPEWADGVFQRLAAKLERERAKVDGYDYCPHREMDLCDCRKPETRLIEKIFERGRGDTKASYIVGDMASDINAGKRMGLKTILVATGCGPNEAAWCSPDYFAENLLEAARIISSA